MCVYTNIDIYIYSERERKRETEIHCKEMNWLPVLLSSSSQAWNSGVAIRQDMLDIVGRTGYHSLLLELFLGNLSSALETFQSTKSVLVFKTSFL